jgi:hypothetical protein
MSYTKPTYDVYWASKYTLDSSRLPEWAYPIMKVGDTPAYRVPAPKLILTIEPIMVIIILACSPISFIDIYFFGLVLGATPN